MWQSPQINDFELAAVECIALPSLHHFTSVYMQYLVKLISVSISRSITCATAAY